VGLSLISSSLSLLGINDFTLPKTPEPDSFASSLRGSSGFLGASGRAEKLFFVKTGNPKKD